MYQIVQFRIQFILLHLAIVCMYCQCYVENNYETNHIEFYNQNLNRRPSSSESSIDKFSIFRKRTRPIYRKNHKNQHLMTDYKLITNSISDQQVNHTKHVQSSLINSPDQTNRQTLKLNKSKANVEFVDIYNRNSNYSDDQLIVSNHDSNVPVLTYAQQTMLAFEHGLRMKREAKCEFPKPTVVYLNQNREQIKVYMPRATILHRCGQNTGCCESESEQCVAIEQKQVNLYFFVIKLEKEFDELSENKLTSVRRGRKYASFDEDSNDNGLLKEYEYNLDYTTGNEIRLTDQDRKKFETLKSENNYLNMLFNEDEILKSRLTRSIDEDESSSVQSSVGNQKSNLSDGESKLSTSKHRRINSKRLYSDLDGNWRYNYRAGKFRNHIRRSLGGQVPKQTIEMLTFTNHTRCGCVNRL